MHRLDKLTSGILVLAKSQDLAMKFQEDLKKNEIGKTYLARVYGDFPSPVGEELVVDKSIYCVSHKLGKYDYCKTEEEEKQGKSAKTIFKKLWYDEVSNSSLVECKPYTGRTHQIRVHCLSVGCSIINDVNYGGVFIGNPFEDVLRKKLGLPQKIQEESELKENNENQFEQINPQERKESSKNFEPIIQKKVKPDPFEKIEEIKKKFENEEKKTDQAEEKDNANYSNEKDLNEVNEEEQTYVMEIWLHSLRYQYKDKTFETSLPYWTNKEINFQVKEFRRTPGWSHK